ncbi:M1 family aminopeptidase [Niabella sp. CJ426]|uniref:ABC transporter permease/M1 family aminopeptidase n=1 Tax=Niabella sp. CJ426 TaxID=3393740 RepID=UPI003D08E7E6
MKHIFLFDIRHSLKSIIHYLAITMLLATGVFCGSSFNLSLGEGIYLNGSYTIGFMLGFMSLTIVFMATVLGSKLLFKERDNRFEPLLFSTSLTEKQYVGGRFISFATLTFWYFIWMSLGFVIGQHYRTGAEMGATIKAIYYLYPVLVFGLINTVMICSVLTAIALLCNNRLLMVLAGILLYILYMVSLIYSGSPFMANALPQSEMAQHISALADPFGLSGYFTNSRYFSVSQRNTSLVPLSGYFLLNRLIITGISICLVFCAANYFSSRRPRRLFSGNQMKPVATNSDFDHTITVPQPTVSRFNLRASFKALQSFIKIDLIYLFKNVAAAAALLLVLFNLGMELYAEIEKGIRLPQLYASSGLMAQTINQNFYVPGAFIILYFANDICWRSHTSRFHLIEHTTYYRFARHLAHFISMGILIIVFTFFFIAEGILFQYIYQYPFFDYNAYGGVFIFSTLPLILLSAGVVSVNAVAGNRYIALGITVVLTVVTGTPLSAKFITLPAFRFLSGFNGVYSDLAGYGTYIYWFFSRWLLGCSVILTLVLLFRLFKKPSYRVTTGSAIVILAAISFFWGQKLIKGYRHETDQEQIENAVSYEKSYRKYQFMPQPTITDVHTQIDLYPANAAYTISGTYIIRNLREQPVLSMLIQFNEELHTAYAVLHINNQHITLSPKITEILFPQPMLPGDTAKLEFRMSYKWYPVNGHRSFNAIVGNGSFMRISRYYPVIGYQSSSEITDTSLRKANGIGLATSLPGPDAPVVNPRNFIRLDMTISTEPDQTAIGTGSLVKHWKNGGRNFYRYQSGQLVPFRFALSSARYAVQKSAYKNIPIYIYYHPGHSENVAQLMKNARQTLEYCTQNFGAYPFPSLVFAEISSFTNGFNATAYPSVVFMTEHMAFHANLKADQQQDVIIELAGHEVSHLWWGNNQIAPDEREGAAMLTETLAMYTEMMLYKQFYGDKKMREKLKMHQQIYESEKGLSQEMPLYKVDGSSSHISYSKGAIVMVKLHDLIGENKLNAILRLFVQKYRYPQRATSINFLQLLYQHTDQRYHKVINAMFTGI